MIIAALSINSIVTSKENAKQSAKMFFKSKQRIFLVQLTMSTAEKNDMLFENIRTDASNAAEHAKNIFDNPDDFASEARWKFDDRVFRGEKWAVLEWKR